MRLLCSALAFVVSLAAFPPASNAGDPPFEVTEKTNRPRCDNYEPNRQPLFGTTHLHTGLSFDASIRFVDFKVNNPRQAYRFAKGEEPITLPDPQGAPTVKISPLDPPLDWGAVTDHSEHFGEMGFCEGIAEGDLPERMSMECRMINGFFYEPGHALNPEVGRTMASNAFTNLTLVSLGAISKNTRLPVCENNPERCDQSEMKVWDEVRLAAEEAYDRSSDCSFTSFIAYENTSTPLLNNWHRNVIFRNDRVVKSPVNAIDMAVRVNEDPTKEPIDTLPTTIPDEPRVWPAPPGKLVTHPLPQPFWNKLERDCTFGENTTGGSAERCDFITIPHNSNLGGGSSIVPPMFLDPYNVDDAKRHAQMEPLVEIYQDKGSSECRYDPRYLAGTDTVDEFCAFEILDGKTLGSASGVGSSTSDTVGAPDTWGNRAYVRNVWKDGIQYAAEGTYDGVNPFKMGVVSASDSHTGVMGWHPENEEWPGHLGIDDIYPVQRASTIQNSSGGHSVVWAEENSRDSIFEALKRKETYGTSGTRIIVRFFGGWDFKDDECGGDFVERGYRHGVPMGGDLPPRKSGEGAPSFVVAAWRDQTPLQQIQIIKGWVSKKLDESTGKWVFTEHEKVVSVVGGPGYPLNPQHDLEEGSCELKAGVGHERLCTVWKDPSFDPGEHAFYYVRVLEEPVCRYSTLWCLKKIGLDPLDHDGCVEKLKVMQKSKDPELLRKASQGAMCCSDQTTVPFVQPVIQERAWTSPIWYEPGR